MLRVRLGSPYGWASNQRERSSGRATVGKGRDMLAVMGCLREMPSAFPVSHAENAGNMIHGNAPFEMFNEVIHAGDSGAFRSRGHGSFADFVNNEASHLILTLANTLKAGDEDGKRYERMTSFLKKIEKPVVVFGLGVQAQTQDVDDIMLHPAAREMIRLLAAKSPQVGVRGRLTAQVLEKECGVTDVRVTGCPSLLSRPDALVALRKATRRDALTGRPAFNGTKFHQASEKNALHRALRAGHFLVEPVNKHNHAFYVAASRGEAAEVPYFLKSYASAGGEAAGTAEAEVELRRLFRENYRLFRSTQAWYDFTSESVSYGYGTRFHGNMATILSGRPALWITHDARTSELVEFAHLPNVTQSQFDEMGWEGVENHLDFEPFFRHISELFDNFNDYLRVNGISPIRTYKDASASTPS